jgi:hypothetical protein
MRLNRMDIVVSYHDAEIQKARQTAHGVDGMQHHTFSNFINLTISKLQVQF